MNGQAFTSTGVSSMTFLLLYFFLSIKYANAPIVATPTMGVQFILEAKESPQ